MFSWFEGFPCFSGYNFTITTTSSNQDLQIPEKVFETIGNNIASNIKQI